MKALTKKSLITLMGFSGVVLVSGFVGCGGDDTVSVVSGDDGGSEGGDASSLSDASPPTDGSTPGTDGSTEDSGTDGGPTTKSLGVVTFTQADVTGPLYQNSATASFAVEPITFDADCVGYATVTTPASTSASCAIKICSDPVTSDAGAAADAGTVIAPNTGTITLTSAADTTGVVLTPAADGTYAAVTGNIEWWAAADNTIEVKSNGSATSIAPFDDTALIGPADPTNPEIGGTNINTSLGALSFDRGTDLAITYSGGTASTRVRVVLTTTSSTKKSTVACSFDAANGAQTIPTADLEHLEQANNSGISGAYTLQGRYTKATTESGFAFDVVLAGKIHSGTFTNSN
jgi:hypothetical protein